MSQPAHMTTPTPFRFVGVSFRSDGSGKLYSYKVPLDWDVEVNRKLKIESRDGGWQIVIIKELDPKPVFGVTYKWAVELVEEPKPALTEIPNNTMGEFDDGEDVPESI